MLGKLLEPLPHKEIVVPSDLIVSRGVLLTSYVSFVVSIRLRNR